MMHGQQNIKFRERLKLKTYQLLVYADLICWSKT